MGDQDRSTTWTRAFRRRAVEAFGVSRATIHHWTETGQLDRDLAAGERVCTATAGGVRSLQGDHRLLEAFPKLSAKRLFDEVRAALPGRLRPREGLRACDPAARARRGAGPVRDAAGAPGPGGLRDVHASLGPALCLGDRPRLLPAAVAGQTMAVLMEALESAFDQFGAGGAAVRPDARCGAVRRSRRRRRPGTEREFLRFAAHWGFLPRSGIDEGQGGAPDSLHSRELLLRPLFVNDDDLNEQAARCWRARPTSPARHDGGTSHRPVRARRAGGASPAIGPYRRLAPPGPETQRLLSATVEVERRPLSVYAEALQ